MEPLVYLAYGVGAIGALAVYCGLPKEGRPARGGLLLMLMAAGAVGLVVLMDRTLGEDANRFYFGLLAVVGVGSAMRVVTHARPVYSALYFVLLVLSTAALVILAGAEFLGVALVIVYAGAILVTYVFVIMMAQQPAEPDPGSLASVLDFDRNAREPFWAVLAGFLLMATVAAMILKRDWQTPGDIAEAPMVKENTLELGQMLMTDCAISVELEAVLLMVAMIGAIAIARKRIPQADDGVERPAPGEIGKGVEPF